MRVSFIYRVEERFESPQLISTILGVWTGCPKLFCGQVRLDTPMSSTQHTRFVRHEPACEIGLETDISCLLPSHIPLDLCCQGLYAFLQWRLLLSLDLVILGSLVAEGISELPFWIFCNSFSPSEPKAAKIRTRKFHGRIFSQQVTLKEVETEVSVFSFLMVALKIEAGRSCKGVSLRMMECP